MAVAAGRTHPAGIRVVDRYHRIAGGDVRDPGADLGYYACKLMSEHDWQGARKLVMNDVHVRGAKSGGPDADHDLIRHGLGHRDIADAGAFGALVPFLKRAHGITGPRYFQPRTAPC